MASNNMLVDLDNVKWDCDTQIEGDREEYKIVAVGDGAVGKTCLLLTYSTKKFPEEYVPTVMDNYSGQIKGTNKLLVLSLWDTSSREDYDRLRPLSYPGTEKRVSFENATTYWTKEVQRHCPGIPVILVGLKSDQRNGQMGVDYVSKEQAEKAVKQLGLNCYMESSAKNNIGLKEVFTTAFKLAESRPIVVSKKSKCIIM